MFLAIGHCNLQKLDFYVKNGILAKYTEGVLKMVCKRREVKIFIGNADKI